MSSSKRLDQIKSARSLNDLLEVVSDIAYEYKNSAAVVKRVVAGLNTSTSAIQRRPSAKSAPAKAAPKKPARAAQVVDTQFDDDEGNITMDMRDQGKAPHSGAKLSNYVPPKGSELQKHVAVINRLHDNARELSSVEAMLKQSFAGNKNLAATLKQVAALKADVIQTVGDAFEALNAIAEKHLPDALSKFIDKVEEHLVKTVPGKSYKDMERQTYVVPDPENKNGLHFCEYRTLTNFKDKSGATYDMYTFVVTGVVDPQGQIKFHVNCFPDFKRPGRYPLGAEVRDANAANKRIDMLLSHNGFVINHAKQPLPFDADRAGNIGLNTIKGVTDVAVKDDDLLVSYIPTISASAKEKMITDILARLSLVVGLNRAGKISNSKVFTRVDDTRKHVLKFSLSPNVDKNEMHFSLQQLDELASALNLTDKQKTAFRFALQN